MMKLRNFLEKAESAKPIQKLEKNAYFIFLSKIVREIYKYNIIDVSSQIAFYFTLSFFPFLFILVSLLPLLPINFSVVSQYVVDYIPSYLQPIIIDDFMKYIDGVSIPFLSFGVLIAIYSSSAVTTLIIKNLNLIFDAKLMRSSIFRRLWGVIINFGFIIIIFSFVLFLLIFNNLLENFTSLTNSNFAGLAGIIEGLFVPFFFFITVLMIYYFSIPKRMKFKDIYIGALFVSIVLVLSFIAFNIYVDNFSVFLNYGLLGGVIILLIYFYILAFIILLGAVINKVIMDY